MAVRSEFSVPSFATTSIVTSASRISPGTIRSLYERATRLRSESVTCGWQKRPGGKGRQGKRRGQEHEHEREQEHEQERQQHNHQQQQQQQQQQQHEAAAESSRSSRSSTGTRRSD